MKNDTSTITIPKSEYESLKTKHAELKARETQLEAEVSELSQQLKWCMEQLRLVRHKQFGASSEKSETFDQINIFNEAEVEAEPVAPEPELTEIKRHFRNRRRNAKDRLPDDLPVEIVEHDLPEDEKVCPECGEPMHVMGHETREELKIIPAKAVIVRHVRKVYACRDCEKNSDHVPIVKATLPEPVIKGSFASPEAIAHIMYQKFVMYAPMYRQEQDWKRNGIMLSRQTMSNWLIRVTQDWLEPIYKELRRKLLEADVLHGDETTLQVLREPGKPAQSKSYMWLYRTSGDAESPIIIYEYQPNRRAENPETFLKNFSGYLHADGYDGYHKLPENITVVGCWSHVRRKWFDALKTLPKEKRAGTNAQRGVSYIDKLFALERQFGELSPEERLRKRQKVAKPILDEFFVWANSLGDAKFTLLGAAAHYTLSQKKYLEHYLLDGRLEISNNRAERSIKPFVMSRKNFLFTNTPAGAQASAVMFSIIETAKENMLNPYEYLTYVFKNAPNWDIHNDPHALARLMPVSKDLPDHIKYPLPAMPETPHYAWEEDV